MLPVWIGIAVLYLVIGIVLSRKCVRKSGVAGIIISTLLWPILLFTGRCEKKPTTVIIPGHQGAQGTQGPQGFQGPHGGVA